MCISGGAVTRVRKRVIWEPRGPGVNSASPLALGPPTVP